MSATPVDGLALSREHRIDATTTQNHAHVVQVACGEDHGLLLTDQGIVYSWAGKSDCGQLGRKAAKEQMFKPMPITEGLKEHIVVQVAVGRHHSLVLTQQGKVLAWGSNKAGQLGIKSMAELFKPKANAKSDDLMRVVPEVVDFDDPSVLVKSISCGPESSACITVKGEIYVWGATSYYMFGQGRHYTRGDNCTRPTKLNRNWRDEVQTGSVGSEVSRDMTLSKIAVYKNQLACIFGYANLADDLDSQLSSLKMRGNHYVHQIRSWKAEGTSKRDQSGADLELEELRTLKMEWRNKKEKLNERIMAIQTEIAKHEAEFQRLSRELTVCDQQDTALTDATVKIEVRRSEGTGQQAQVVARNLDTQLNDLTHFKDANKRTKMRLLEQRDRNEQQRWQLDQELKDKQQELKSVEMRSDVLQNLQRAEAGRQGGSNSTIDEGLNIAYSKHHELAATDPETLAGVGQFTGFREVMMISDRALQDVSSALKEVSAALGGKDGATLESVLEVNLKLRKEHNAAIYEKLQRVEGGRQDHLPHSDGADGHGPAAEGIPDFFEEARSTSFFSS
mmetsp:Transcript_26512/g.61874  ORF Transcript_26512/g.61874 Transcript_26512/m.61874 type:complete len:563 (-) Transcript_26512:226-1914(-)